MIIAKPASLAELREGWANDPEFVREYDALEVDFAMVTTCVTVLEPYNVGPNSQRGHMMLQTFIDAAAIAASAPNSVFAAYVTRPPGGDAVGVDLNSLYKRQASAP